MTQEQIDQLINTGKFPEPACNPELIETHISWIILCDQYAFKIKKPIRYSFLDFSTLEKRKFYCQKEIDLNGRLTDHIYLEVVQIRNDNGQLAVEGNKGEVIDFAVKMNKLDRQRQMDVLLKKHAVTYADMEKLAIKIADFHARAPIIYSRNMLDVREKFNDLMEVKVYVESCLERRYVDIITNSIDHSDAFLSANRQLMTKRLKEGFYRDGHGDLHAKNIFLLLTPQPFDCIEFNDEFRQIDVLNEIAFLCMDLDAFGRQDLSEVFLNCYNKYFLAMRSDKEFRLFVYFKSYRANVRAKINVLRARTASTEEGKNTALAEAIKYFQLMDFYMESLP